ncbi:hypothetical protein V9K67_26805 [Paraflavisolibacter sp. H34]|uniref:hypothetical protein n=1 Tax=Huijunlia imazamoxiresistens TaxID=3127457 RepID=UPI00301AC2F1
MTLTFMGLLLFAAVLALILFIFARARQDQQKGRQALTRYTREVEEKHRLELTYREPLDSGLLALDEPGRQLLVVTQNGSDCQHTLADLSEMKSCRLVKSNRTVPLDKEGKKVETFLDAITLALEPAGHRQEPVSIPFYSHSQHSVYQIAEREQLARQWQERIGQLLKT